MSFIPGLHPVCPLPSAHSLRVLKFLSWVHSSCHQSSHALSLQGFPVFPCWLQDLGPVRSSSSRAPHSTFICAHISC